MKPNTLVVFSGFIINELVWSVKGRVEVDGEKQTVSAVVSPKVSTSSRLQSSFACIYI